MTESTELPAALQLGFREGPLVLRYGENPHQVPAKAYVRDGANPWWAHCTQHSGRGLSYLNLYDADFAWRLACDPVFGEQARCAIIKHANPCGFAIAGSLSRAYQDAYACDETSAMGGIVVCNRLIDAATVVLMEAAQQADVIFAPGYEPGVVERLIAKRKNTIILQAPPYVPDELHFRAISGGVLVQPAPHVATTRERWMIVTRRQPTEAELRDAEIAFALGDYLTSNSIVHVKNGVAWGIGVGQPNRLASARIATEKAAGRAVGGATGSDAFFPFPDGVDAAIEAGVSVIIQPGGAQRDNEVIDRANEHGVAMIFTGERHFRH